MRGEFVSALAFDVCAVVLKKYFSPPEHGHVRDPGGIARRCLIYQRGAAPRAAGSRPITHRSGLTGVLLATCALGAAAAARGRPAAAANAAAQQTGIGLMTPVNLAGAPMRPRRRRNSSRSGAPKNNDYNQYN